MASAPAPEQRVPALKKKSFDCPHCATFANQVWMTVYRSEGSGSFNEAHDLVTRKMSGDKPILVRTGTWLAARCDACRDFSMWRDDNLIYPRTSSITPPATDMPSDVAELYEEARQVMAVSRRAGAALARATLEKLLKNLDGTPGPRATLAARIDAIAHKVSTPLAEMLTVIRHVGNMSLHVEDEPDDSVVLILDETQTELVGLIFVSINELVDELITRPATTKRFLGLVPENVLKNVKGLQAKKD